MRKGFSLLELLVASLLLGMLMTILTMVFTQSSIAWRTGIAGLSDLDKVRETVGQVRNDADNAYVVTGENNAEVASIVSIWRSDSGDKEKSKRLRRRALYCTMTSDVFDDTVEEGEKIGSLVKGSIVPTNDKKSGGLVTGLSLGCGSGESVGGDDTVTYSVNVRCAGPDRRHNTFDDIWSFPDDFDL